VATITVTGEPAFVYPLRGQPYLNVGKIPESTENPGKYSEI
jgi:hypothetical protein